MRSVKCNSRCEMCLSQSCVTIPNITLMCDLVIGSNDTPTNSTNQWLLMLFSTKIHHNVRSHNHITKHCVPITRGCYFSRAFQRRLCWLIHHQHLSAKTPHRLSNGLSGLCVVMVFFEVPLTFHSLFKISDDRGHYVVSSVWKKWQATIVEYHRFCAWSEAL